MQFTNTFTQALPKILLAPLGAILLMLSWYWLEHPPINLPSSLPAIYRYPYTPLEHNWQLSSFFPEISFHQERIHQNPQDGLELAALAGVYLQMARATGSSHHYLEAKQYALHSLNNLPFYNTTALLVLAKVAEAKHDFPEAIHLASEVLEQKSGDESALAILITSYLALGKVDEADKIVTELVKSIPSLGAFSLQALVYQVQVEDQKAKIAFESAIAAEDTGEELASARVRTLYARFLASQGDDALAEKLYKEALRIAPEYPLALVMLAELKLKQGKYSVAERHFEKVLELYKASAQTLDHVVLRGLAKAKALKGDTLSAQDLWTEAEQSLRAEVANGAFGHKRELARLLLESQNQEYYPEALELATDELSVRYDAETLYIYSWALYANNKFLEAQEALSGALTSTNKAEVFHLTGLIEQALGGGARVHFEKSKKSFNQVNHSSDN